MVAHLASVEYAGVHVRSGARSTRNKVLGLGTDIATNTYDEYHTVIPVKGIVERFARNANRGVVCLVGLQSNQFPRAMDMAREFRKHGIAVAIGGIHVGGLMSMIPKMPPDLCEAVDLGITLFAGEAEGRFGDFLRSADPIPTG
ncbi:MAG: hypothetical protein ACI9DC_000260 [Gammaproteobacteria bacterium]